MGIFEFHFHESEFTFEPSMTFPGEGSEEEAVDAAAEGGDTDAEPVPAGPGMDETSATAGGNAKTGLAVLLGLAFLVGVGAVAKKAISKQRAAKEADDRLTTEKVEESVEIAD